MVKISVDLPHPFGPRIATCSPARIERFTSCSTMRSPPPTFTWASSRNCSSLPAVSSFRLSVIHPPHEATFVRLNGLATLFRRRSDTNDPANISKSMSDLSQFVIPRGFRFGAAKAGLKQSGRTDFALIVADAPASAAAEFTANRVKGAPLLVDREHLRDEEQPRATGSKIRVVAINAGNANCAAGQAGIDAARVTCKAAAETFACKPEEVFPSS